MSDKKEIKEIDVASLDSELAAARTLEEGKGDKFIMMASVVAFLMTSFHIYTGFFGLFDYSVQRGVHLGFALTLILLTQPLYKHVFKDKFAGSKAFRAACRTFDMILVVLTWVSVWMAQDEVHHLTERLSKTTWMATFAGACLVIIVLEAARRFFGQVARELAARADLGEFFRVHADVSEHIQIVLPRAQVHQQPVRGIGHVGRVHMPGQAVDQIVLRLQDPGGPG